MIKTINIERQAFGSRTDNIGDTTLYYSANCSSHSSDVKGQFLDNPPKLSPRHASLVWRYNADVDKYLLIHVQGSHVVNSALGRQYTFRAGYEVSRDDMNAIGFSLIPLFQAMPKMANMPSGRVEAQTEVNTNSGKATSGSNSLASHLLKSVMDGQPLYISIDSNEDSLQNDGVFESSELKTLLATIDNMPVDKRRYVTFGFCVDDHYASVLEEVPVIIYLKGSQITIPQKACHMTWKEVTTSFAGQPLLDTAQIWRGADTPLLTQEQLTIMRKTVNGADSLKGEEWSVWTDLGHQLSELKIDSWEAFATWHEQMDEKTRIQLIDAVKEQSLSWRMEGLTEDLYKIMDYSQEQEQELQEKPFVDYLLQTEGFKYGFLYPKGLTKHLKDFMKNELFLKTLVITAKDSAIKWYDIYQQHKVQTHATEDFFSNAYCKLTDGTLEEVTETFQLVSDKKAHFLQEAFLRKMKKETLTQLLRNAPQPSDMMKQSEQLLQIAEQLPKSWKPVIEQTLRPAVIEALRTDSCQLCGPLAESRTNDLLQAESYYWKLEMAHPLVYDMVHHELQAIRQKRHEETINKGNKNHKDKKSKTASWHFSKLFWSLVGWFVGLLMGAGVVLTFALCSGQIKF